MQEPYDDAIVGAGIIGLAHAYHLARRGRRVGVFERGPKAFGASVRNFGMLWPIGQPGGQRYRMALRSREYWLEVLTMTGLWHDRCGSLHLAYEEDEAAVLREFIAGAPGQGFDVCWLEPGQVRALSGVVRAEELKGAMFSPTETCVDPRQVVATLPAFLSERYGVTFHFGCTVIGYERPRIRAGGETWEAENLYVCSGDDLQTLYPEVLMQSGLTPCKLQMMRTAPTEDGWHLGPMLAAGLTLRHYRSFENCPSLPALQNRFEETMPEYGRWGIHVMASQNGNGEVVLGDSHEYGDEARNPFDREEIDRLVLDYLRNFLNIDGLTVAARWNGVYVKHPTEPYVCFRPEPGVTLVTGVGGAGMTLSFGLAEKVVAENL